MSQSLSHALPHTREGGFLRLFLGSSPLWYKQAVIACLVLNPMILFTAGPFVAGWLILIEFIATLALALKCYPLQPGGLLVVEAVILQLLPLPAFHEEVSRNMPVLFLVLFVVTAVSFLKELLVYVFTRLVLLLSSKTFTALFFLGAGAILSALLDALTVIAVVIAVFSVLYAEYHRYASGKEYGHDHDHSSDQEIHEHHHEDLEGFRAFLRSLVMHAAVGTMLGGILTIIGEPQNLLIGTVMKWSFLEFFLKMAPVTIPVLVSGLLVGILLEKLGWSDFGAPLPANVRRVLEQQTSKVSSDNPHHRQVLCTQLIGAILLVLCLVFHVTEVYLIGLGLLIVLTAFNGVTDEHRIGNATKEAAPFVFVLAVFFGIVTMIHSQHLFDPVTAWALSFEGKDRLIAYFAATGLLSSISDNVFVASLYITDVERLFNAGVISKAEFEHLAVAINTGTNIPSIATPNGQAAFLFLLMSPIAPLIRLSYGRMALLAFPYMVVTTGVGVAALYYFL